MRPYSGRKWMSRRSAGRASMSSRQRTPSAPSVDRISKATAHRGQQRAGVRAPFCSENPVEAQSFDNINGAFRRVPVAKGIATLRKPRAIGGIFHNEADRLDDRNLIKINI